MIPLESWISYFQYLTAAAAALLSIAFLVFQIRADIWVRKPLKHAIAIRTLTEIAAPMFFGLIFLAPTNSWHWGGRITGGAIILTVCWHIYKYVRHHKEAQLFDTVEVVGNVLLVVTSSLLIFHPDLWVKAFVALWMIFSGSVHAWIYLWFASNSKGVHHPLDASRSDKGKIGR